MATSTELTLEVQTELNTVLAALPSNTDLLFELKTSLIDVIPMKKEDAISFLQRRLEPGILVNDDVTPKRHIYRTILSIYEAFGVEINQRPGMSTVEVTINTVFNTAELEAPRTLALSLYSAHLQSRASGIVTPPSQPQPPQHPHHITRQVSSGATSSQDYRSPRFHNMEHNTGNPRAMQPGGPLDKPLPGDNQHGDVRDGRRTVSNQFGYQSNDDNIARKISSAQYSLRDNKFSGSLESNISLHRFKQLFFSTADQFQIPSQFRTNLLIYGLEGTALSFFLDKVHNRVHNVNEAFTRLSREFDTAQSQTQAQSYLDSLTIASLRDTHQCSTARALEIAQQKIAIISPMCGPEYNDDSHKARWLSNMVKGEDWASHCCETRMTHALSYSMFCSSLHAAITQRSIAGKEPTQIRRGDVDCDNRENYRDRMASTWYGQRYATPMHKRRLPPHKRRKARTAQQLRELKARTRCLKCGERGHWRAECPRKDLSLSNAIASRLGGNANTVDIRHVLDALAYDEDDYVCYMMDMEAIMANAPVDSPSDPDAAWSQHLMDDPFESLLKTLDITDENTPNTENICDNTTDDISVINCVIQEGPVTNTLLSWQRYADRGNTLAITPPHNGTQDAVAHSINLVAVQDSPPRIRPVLDTCVQPLTTMDIHHLGTPRFLGALVDTGAQRTVIGLPQAFAYFAFSGQPAQFIETQASYRFGKTIFDSSSAITIHIPTPKKPLIVRVDVVPCDVPLLLGLNTMIRQGLQPLIVQRQMHSVKENWRTPIVLERGHLYWRWLPPRGNLRTNEPSAPACLTVTAEPNSRMRLRNILSGDAPTDAADNRMRIQSLLDDADTAVDAAITDTGSDVATSNDCAPDDDRNTSETDTLFPHGFTPSQMKRIHRHFGHVSARKLYELIKRSLGCTPPPKTLERLDDIVKACATCTEFAPKSVSFKVRHGDVVLFNHRLLMDVMHLPTRDTNCPRRQKPVLHIVDTGTRFNAAAFLEAGTDATQTWNAFIKVWSSMYVGMPTSILVDQGSVFVSDQWKHACELNSIELQATGTESHNSLNAGESYHAYLRRIYQKLCRDFPKIPEDVILAMATKAINDTTGPRGLCPTLLVFGQMPKLSSGSRQDHATQTDRHRAAAEARLEYEKIVAKERLRLAARKQPPQALEHRFTPGDLVYLYREKERRHTGPHMVASVVGKQVRLHVGDRRGPREFNISQLRPSPLPNAFDSNETEPRYHPMILYSEIIDEKDHRAELFTLAKRKELLGLLERGVFKVVLREEAGPNPNIIPSRFVLTIKHSTSGEPPRLKARFVLGGHKDRDKNKLVHDTRTARQENVRLVVALGTIFGLTLSMADWQQGYAQCKSSLLRKIYIRPKELELEQDELVQILKPLYGLSDAGDYWADTLADHLAHHCQFSQAKTDLALWFKVTAKKLLAAATTYVDDVLIAATPETMNRFTELSRARFDVNINEADNIGYLGLQIRTLHDGTRAISQPAQIRRAKLLPADTSFDEYRSARASLAWLQHTRPDICCALSMSARVTTLNFAPPAIAAYNSIVRYIRRTPNIQLKFPKLDAKSLRIATYVDASHRNLKDGYSQIGYLICLADKFDRCAIICYSSKKAKRIVRSTTASEALAFADGFDAAFAIQADLSLMLSERLPIIMITDSEILFNVITRKKTTTERRLMIDLCIARAAYANREISNIVLIASDDNPADCLTKVRANQAMRYLLESARLKHRVLQYVIEPRS